MFSRFMESDASSNGLFWTGVVTTGIYCLPSCNARKPLRKNIRFFPSIKSAMAANLRACKQCRPDDFARGIDPVLEQIEILAAEVRDHPENFPQPASMVKRSGFGTTRLFELFREHFHTTPGEYLLAARIETARLHLLKPGSSVSDAALETGFRSLSTFHDQFRRRLGMTPAEYQQLPGKTAFRITLPADYDLPYLIRALSRDKSSVTERFENGCFTTVVRTTNGPAWMEVKLEGKHCEVKIGDGQKSVELHCLICRLLGLAQDPRPFISLVTKLGLPQLVEGRKGLRISLTPSVLDGIVWAILGQQITVSFAAVLRARLTTHLNEVFHDNLHAPPSAEQLARLTSEELIPLQFSKQKAAYIIGIARMIVSGELDLKALSTMSATRASRTLLAIKGLGPWSVNYILMRSLGHADCLPLGDTGLTTGLKQLFNTDRPDVGATKKLMAPFSPYRSLATAHLWQLPHPAPTISP